MPSAFRKPKDLPQWIELDYYERPRPLRRWRGPLGWLTLLLSTALLGGLIAGGNRLLFQAAPLAGAHRFFNDDCAACHQQNFRTALRILPHRQAERSVPDTACTACHAGAEHHRPGDNQPCVRCHQEHRDRPSLSQVPDQICTACHQDLRGTTGQEPRFANHITGFLNTPHPHPEFAWLKDNRKDPGQLKFNHAVHLGLADKLERLKFPPGIGQDVARRLQLLKEQQCAFCHVPDAQGRYMEPIRYDKHCQACHVIPARIYAELQDPKARAAAAAFRLLPAPHEEPGIVRGKMYDRYLGFLRMYPVGEPDAPPLRPLPGRERSPAATPQEWDWVQRQLRELERELFDHSGACAYCHVETRKFGPDRLPEYARTGINDRPHPVDGKVHALWLPHGLFSHSSHRMLTCTSCHDAATSKDTADVLLPKLASCQTCHTPSLGVRSDCVQCHRFHDRDNERAFKGTHTLSTFGHGP